MPLCPKHFAVGLTVAALLLAAVTSTRAQSNDVHGNGTTLAIGATTFTPRGVNLGNWFVPHPTCSLGVSSNEQLRTALLALAGSTANYQAWRASYLTMLKYATGLTPGSPATNSVSPLPGGSSLAIKFTRLNPQGK